MKRSRYLPLSAAPSCAAWVFAIGIAALAPLFGQEAQPTASAEAAGGIAAETEGAKVLRADDPRALAAHQGEQVTVAGIVAETRKSRGGTNFVHFEDSEFYLVTFKTDLARFGAREPADLYAGKIIEVDGTITLYKGKPQIKLSRPDQVRIMTAPGNDQPAPDPAPVASNALPSNEGEGGSLPAPSVTNPAAEPTSGAKGPRLLEDPTNRPPVNWRLYFK